MMYFVLSKTVSLLLLPTNLLFFLILVGLLLIVLRRPRAGKVLAATGFVLLLLIGFLPVGYWLSHSLEKRFPNWDASRGPPDGIVVLGGVISPRLSRARHQIALSDSAERVTIIAKLARDYPKARIIFTGGDTGVLVKEGAEADYLLPLLATFGVPAERVTLEGRARNTRENALYAKALAQPKPGERWLLVTSARHMPRAVGSFRAVGFPVEAYPVDWHTMPRLRAAPMSDIGEGLWQTDDAVHEWIGVVVYWLNGWTSALLPTP